MGHSWVEVEISNLKKTKSKKVNALVDTGATLTVLPKMLAEELGIKPSSVDEILTGAGTVKVELQRKRSFISTNL
jgi:predicted aspartyl protease